MDREHLDKKLLQSPAFRPIVIVPKPRSLALALLLPGAPPHWGYLVEIDVQGHPAPVPEPETCSLMLAGLGLVGFAARRRSS